MSEWVLIVLVALGSYLAGSLPFGVWVTKAWSGVNIREVGSGNIGATNVLRAAGWRPALAVFMLDAAKGALPVLAGQWLAARGGYSATTGLAITLGAGAFALLGHTSSVFLGMRGGRGVATGLGVLTALSWQAGLSGLGVFIIIACLTRVVSLASIAGAATTPVFMLVYHRPRAYAIFAAAAAVLVIARHAPNIKRLLRGEESRIGGRGKEQPRG